MRFSQIFQRTAKVYCAPSYSVDEEILDAAKILTKHVPKESDSLFSHNCIPMMIEGEMHYISVFETRQLLFWLNQIYGKDMYWATCNGKPIRAEVDWELYYNGRIPDIKVHPRIKGGARRCDYIVIPERQPKWSMLPEYGHTQRYFKQYRKQQKFEFWSTYKLSNVEETFELQSRNGVESVDF